MDEKGYRYCKDCNSWGVMENHSWVCPKCDKILMKTTSCCGQELPEYFKNCPKCQGPLTFS